MPRRCRKKTIEQLSCDLERLRAAARAEEQKQALRQKIILGAAVMKAMARSPYDQRLMLYQLDAFVTRDCDRKVVNLPPLGTKAPKPRHDHLDGFFR